MKKRVSIIVAAVAFFVMLFGLCNISALAGEPQYYTLRFFSGGGVTSSNETKIEMRIPVGQPFPAEDSITKFNRVGYDFKGFWK